MRTPNINIIGKKFGNLTVISRQGLDKSGKNSTWECLCDCGKKIIIIKTSLKRGQKSCGCMNPIPKPPPRKMDLIGKKFNFLTAISWIGGDQSYWLCKCICGKEIKIQRHDLLRNKRKSCGCIKPNHKSTIDKFLKKVLKTETCWIWKGALNNHGYGQFSINYKNITSHRASWIFHKGEIPKGKLICHHCDNRKCVNPEHLYIGTHKTNALDRVKRNFKSFKKVK